MIVADFTGGKEMYTEIGPQLTGLDIGVLGECLWGGGCTFDMQDCMNGESEELSCPVSTVTQFSVPPLSQLITL